MLLLLFLHVMYFVLFKRNCARYGNSEDVVYHLRATSVLSSSDDEDIE